MEMILAENRRLQLLCSKMMADKGTAPAKKKASSRDILGSLDFFGEDCDTSQVIGGGPLTPLSSNLNNSSSGPSSFFASQKLEKRMAKVTKGYKNVDRDGPWSKHTDPKTGRKYYHNKLTGKSVWKDSMAAGKAGVGVAGGKGNRAREVVTVE
jgi:hypothetical protein